ncbi:MAG: tetratricopeptide repeat protein [Deltaproteobacteria bacterium]|nr:tetratricopeptide repeat protein [Deltaproteobacteria bacterium]
MREGPETAAELIEQARSRFERGDLVAALAAFESALAADPTSEDALFGRDSVLAILDDPETAIGFYTEAIEATGGHAEMFLGRAHMRWHAGDLAGAIVDYTEAIERTPAPASIHCHRARAREAAGDLDGATDDYRRAVELGSPDDAFVLDAETEIARIESRLGETLMES